ncbi:MAG: hypothetical protein H0Z37_04920, partial [Firmicutes bacterium]|nr:hypothetical protein [Bacillota bacterium]
PGTYPRGGAASGGSAADNYVLAASGNTPGTLVINPKKLSLSPATIYLQYGDTTGGRKPREVPLPELLGVLDGDDVSLDPSKFWYYQKHDPSSYPDGVDIPVGEYTVRPREDVPWEPLTGDHSDRYVLPIENAPAVNLVVEPKTIYYRVSVNSIEYGESPSVNVMFDGIVENDGNIDVVWHDATTLRFWQGGSYYEWTNTLEPGEYTVTIGGLDPSAPAARNYELDITSPRNTPGTLTVDPRTIDISDLRLNVARGVYGDELIVDVPDVSGLKARIGLKLEDGRIELTPGAGTYPDGAVIVELLGNDMNRYRLKPEEARGTATLEIAQRPLTVSLVSFARTYGDPLSVPMDIQNLGGNPLPAPGDFTFRVLKPGMSQILTERTPVGVYTIEVVELDHPNYILAESGHTQAQVEIVPRPVRYKTYDGTVEYGQDGSFIGQADLFEEDVLPGDQVDAGPVVVQIPDEYPLPYLEADAQYPLVLAGLKGSAAGNYVPRHEGSVLGMLTVTKRKIEFEEIRLLYKGHPIHGGYTFGDFEMAHGLVGDPANSFTVDIDERWGLLTGDDVRYVIRRPELSFSSQGYLSVGTYEWTIDLEGSAARNYELPTTGSSVKLMIDPRIVRSVTFETETLTYGDDISVDAFRPVFDFDGDNDALFADADFELAPLVIRGPGDFEVLVDDLWRIGSVRAPQAGEYGIWLLDDKAPPFRGPDAANFRYVSPLSITGTIQVKPRTLTLSPPAKTQFPYGSQPQWRDLYGEIVPVDPDVLEVFLEGDDVRLEFVDGWRLDENGEIVEGGRMQWFLSQVEIDGQWVETYVLDRATTLGTYGRFQFRLVGPQAGNYELIQPTHTIDIVPKPVNPFQAIGFIGWMEDIPTFYERHTYGDEMLVDPDDLVFPGYEDCCTVAYRDDEGHLIPVSELNVGSYAADRLELVGSDADKYVIDLTYSGEGPITRLDIAPRELLYSIADVVGQYGNFLPCDDPNTCNGGRKPDWSNVWQPGLTTGEVTLYGILEGDDVRPGQVVLVDVLGRTGTLEDVPEPGMYFQVLASLEGEDAPNYYIGETGNKPGTMQIHRLWVQWDAYDALYSPVWGFVSHHPGSDTWATGLGADTLVAGEKLNLRPRFGLFWYPPEHKWSSPEYWVRVEQWAVSRYPGFYWIMVDGFEGEHADYFIPFPWDFDSMGQLTAFADTTLGLEFAEAVGDPFGQMPTVNKLRQLEAQEQLQQQEANEEGAEEEEENPTAVFGRTVGATSDMPELPPIFEFGRDVDYEEALSSDVAARAYAEALAQYGVTGVSLEANTGVEVVYDFGEGYIRAGADASAEASIGLGGLEASAEASVGTSAGTSLEYEIAPGVSGEFDTELGLVAKAEAEVAYGIEDGKLRLGHELKAGAGAEYRASTSIDMGGLEVDPGVTVFSPGLFVTDVDWGFGVEDGRLVFGLTGGLALGIGGINVDLVIAIDPDAVRDFLVDAGEAVADAFQSMGCEIGLGGCGPSPEEIGREQLRQAMQIEDPLVRAAFLQENAEWRLVGRGSDSPELSRAYDESVRLLNTLDLLERNVQRYVDLQREMRAHFLEDVERDPQGALAVAQSIMNMQMRESGPGAHLMQAIQEDLNALGLRLVASGNAATFEWIGGQ